MPLPPEHYLYTNASEQRAELPVLSIATYATGMTTTLRTVAVELTDKDLSDLADLAMPFQGKDSATKIDMEMAHAVFRAGIDKLREERADTGYTEYAKLDELTSERRAARRTR